MKFEKTLSILSLELYSLSSALAKGETVRKVEPYVALAYEEYVDAACEAEWQCGNTAIIDAVWSRIIEMQDCAAQ